MRTATLIRWHRRLAWVAAITLTLWAGSGALHPLMSWVSPRPAAFAPPKAEMIEAGDWVRPEAVLQSAGIEEVRTLRYLAHKGEAVLQVTQPDVPERLYFNAETGTPLPDVDRERAILLARHYSGETAPVLSAEMQTQFERAYPSVNRYLPVWKLRFDTPDALTVYVDTGSGRLAAMHNRARLAMLYAFQIVHTLDFLESAEALRLTAIAFAVASLLGASGLGMAMLYALKRPKTPKGTRGWHRRLAWVMWLPLACFGMSGLLHLFAHSPVNAPVMATPSRVAAKTLVAMPALEGGMMEAQLVQDTYGIAWRVVTAPDSEAMILRAAALPQAEKEALKLRFPRAKEEISLLTHFGPEYGFAYKRLPVWRVATETGDLIFFDPVDQVIAHRATTFKRAETWSFSTLHKWQFLEAFGIRKKDGFLLAAACLMLAFAAVGIKLLLRKT
ncbi:MAG: hypothetical protein J0L97_11155 [Alphaproteobacteria bacterium]|nr:hypothetical protein [Alphaproteobacteria bacterium]